MPKNKNSGSNPDHRDPPQETRTQDPAPESGEMESRSQQNPDSRDKLVLTELASKLKALEHDLAKQPEVDQNHVNRVREAIKRGEYHVSPDRVAGKMLGFEEDF